MFHVIVFFWYHLTGVFGESLSVTEGDPVTLHNDITECKDCKIVWAYGASEMSETSLIGYINRNKQIFSTYDGPDGRFRDRLKLDQTGSLTITDITTQHAGVYKLLINEAKRLTKIIHVSVYAHLPIPVISSNSSNCSSSSLSSCSLLCSVVNVGHVTLSWFKGNSLLFSISLSDLSISLSLPLEVEYQDKNTYSCVVNNPVSNQTTHLDINTVCNIHSDEGLPLLYMLLISAAAGSLLIVATVVLYCIIKKCRKTVIAQQEDRTHSALCKPTGRTKSKIDHVYENVPTKR